MSCTGKSNARSIWRCNIAGTPFPFNVRRRASWFPQQQSFLSPAPDCCSRGTTGCASFSFTRRVGKSRPVPTVAAGAAAAPAKVLRVEGFSRASLLCFYFEKQDKPAGRHQMPSGRPRDAHGGLVRPLRDESATLRRQQSRCLVLRRPAHQNVSRTTRAPVRPE